MATNDYVPFAYSSGANVMSPAAWAGLGARLNGFVSGTALSVQCNTAWRQSSVVAAMIGEFIAEHQSLNVVDNGDVEGLENQFEKALQNWLGAIGRFVIYGNSAPWIVPENVNTALVEIIAGAGGGGTSSWYPTSSGIIQGNGGGGGGAGGWALAIVTGLTPGQSVPVTIGLGGYGGIDPNTSGAQPGWTFPNGQSGNASSFGPYVTVYGGGGGLDGSNYCTNSTPPPYMGGGPGGGGTFGSGAQGLVIAGQQGGFTGCNHQPTQIDATDVIRTYYVGGIPGGGWGTTGLGGSGGAGIGSGWGVGGSGSTGYTLGNIAGAGAQGLAIIRW